MIKRCVIFVGAVFSFVGVSFSQDVEKLVLENILLSTARTEVNKESVLDLKKQALVYSFYIFVGMDAESRANVKEGRKAYYMATTELMEALDEKQLKVLFNGYVDKDSWEGNAFPWKPDLKHHELVTAYNHFRKLFPESKNAPKAE
jgi:hypothetical protein